MDIWLIYIIKTLILPASSLLLFSLACCVFLLKQSLVKMLLILALLLLVILSMPIVGIKLNAIQQIHPVLNLSGAELKTVQAIVVIGGGKYTDAVEYGEQGTVNHRTLLRLRYAAKLAKQLELPVLVSGGSVVKKSDTSEAELMTGVLEDEFNIPVQWQERQSRNTAENAIFSYEILQADNISHIILVTQALHMVRAYKQFTRVGFKVLAAPTVLAAKPDLTLLLCLPSAQGLEMSTMAIHEYLGRLWYSIRY